MSIYEFNSLVITNVDGLKPVAVILTRDRETAKDLFQETIYKAFAHRDQYQSGTNIKAWLSTIMLLMPWFTMNEIAITNPHLIVVSA